MGIVALTRRWSGPKAPHNIVHDYVLAGLEAGSTVGLVHATKNVGFRELLHRWETLERMYAELGYRTVPLSAFAKASRFGDWSRVTLMERRLAFERPVYHATAHRERTRGTH